jgi:hypothetical protein
MIYCSCDFHAHDKVCPTCNLLWIFKVNCECKYVRRPHSAIGKCMLLGWHVLFVLQFFYEDGPPCFRSLDLLLAVSCGTPRLLPACVPSRSPSSCCITLWRRLPPPPPRSPGRFPSRDHLLSSAVPTAMHRPQGMCHLFSPLWFSGTLSLSLDCSHTEPSRWQFYPRLSGQDRCAKLSLIYSFRRHSSIIEQSFWCACTTAQKEAILTN